MAVVSIVCFNTVLMAWYGVNFVLGTGLHSYGFSTGGSELIIGSLVLLDLLFVLATYGRVSLRRRLESDKTGSFVKLKEELNAVE